MRLLFGGRQKNVVLCVFPINTLILGIGRYLTWHRNILHFSSACRELLVGVKEVVSHIKLISTVQLPRKFFKKKSKLFSQTRSPYHVINDFFIYAYNNCLKHTSRKNTTDEQKRLKSKTNPTVGTTDIASDNTW